jgi:hypothetical protein
VVIVAKVVTGIAHLASIKKLESINNKLRVLCVFAVNFTPLRRKGRKEKLI